MMVQYVCFLRMFALFVMIVSCSGCFEIVEEVSFNPNESGNISVTLNASRSRDKIKQIMLLDKVNGIKIPNINEIKTEVLHQRKKLDAQPGISNVKITEDYDNFIFSVSCNFQNAKNLEQAIITLLENSKHKSVFSLKTGNFVYKDKIFTCKVRLPQNNTSHLISQQQKEFLRDANYTAIYRFPGTIYKNTNPNARISPSKKAVMFRSNVLDIIENRKSPNLYIKHQ